MARRFPITLFSPRIVGGVVATLGRPTALVVGVCWLGAALSMVAAMSSVHLAALAKKDLTIVSASEPVVPTLTASAIDPADFQAIIEKLQRQFPDTVFETDGVQEITLKMNDSSKFRQWANALNTIDVLAPHYRWTLSEFCVGHCDGPDLMRAVVTGQKVDFALSTP